MNTWYKNLKKAPFSPPSWIFGVVWPILYCLMFIALFLVWTNDKCKPYCSAVTYFAIQLILNLMWTTIFFKNQNPQLALLDIALIIIFTYFTWQKFNPISKMAGNLLVPYLAWLSFAFLLNLYIVIHN